MIGLAMLMAGGWLQLPGHSRETAAGIVSGHQVSTWPGAQDLSKQ